MHSTVDLLLSKFPLLYSVTNGQQQQFFLASVSRFLLFVRLTPADADVAVVAYQKWPSASVYSLRAYTHPLFFLLQPEKERTNKRIHFLPLLLLVCIFHTIKEEDQVDGKVNGRRRRA